MACADPAGRLDDFANRVTDANNATADAEILTSIPDITGDFLFAMDPSAFPGSLFKFRAHAELIDGTTDEPKVRIQLFALDARNNVEIGEAVSTDPEIMPVSITGEFSGHVTADTPGKTNPVSGTALTVDIDLNGIVRSENHFCGTVNGSVTAPFTLDLTGSTFGAVRVPDGGTMNDVTPTGTCIASPDDPDAGVPDAGAPDAGAADAGVPDANDNKGNDAGEDTP